MGKNKNLKIIFGALLVGIFIFNFDSVNAQPTQSPGTGSGAIAADGTGNLGVGTSTLTSTIKLKVVASTSNSTSFGLQVLQPAGGVILSVRGDGRVGIGTSAPSYPLSVVGNIEASGGTFIGSLAASNVTSGVFGSGNFAFPSSLGAGYSSQVGLPATLSILGSGSELGLARTGFNSWLYGVGAANGVNGLHLTDSTASRSILSFQQGASGNVIFNNIGNVGIGSTTPASKLSINGSGSSNIDLNVTGRILTGDSNNSGGMWVNNGQTMFFGQSGATQMGLWNGGWRLLVNNNGNVGIATTTPAYPLSVQGQVNASGGLCIAGDCKTAWSQVGGTTMAAANISTGTFGANTGGGVYAFASSVEHTGNIFAQQSGVSPVGVYNPSKTQQVWAMGSCYRLPDAGATVAGTYGTSCANFYGIGYSYEPDYGGAGNNPQSKTGLSHQALFMMNGVTQTAVGTGVWTLGNVTGNAFYDQNNATYYVDPAGSTSAILNGSVRIGSNVAPSNALHVTGNVGATGWVGAGCEGACESSGGYGLLYDSGRLALSDSAGRFTAIKPRTGTYTSAEIEGSNGGYSGITFTGVTTGYPTMMVHNTTNLQGFYKEGTGWSWYFQDGMLTVGGVNTASSVTGGEVYSANWFRNNITGTGLYNSANANHIYSNSANYWDFTAGTGSPAGGIRLMTTYNGVVRGYVYSDGSNFGLLNNAGSWAVQIPNGGVAVNLLGTVTVGGGTGKINVGTVDPIYTIGGKKYATYLPAMTGQKEETTGVWQLTPDSEGNWLKEIDFKNLEEASDLWLFAKSTDLKSQFDKMMVLLTPSFNGNVWYERDTENMKLIIHGEHGGEVSYRLTATRFDAKDWGNRADKEEAEGFNLDKLLKE